MFSPYKLAHPRKWSCLMFYVYSIYDIGMVQPLRVVWFLPTISIERKLNKFLNVIRFMESNIANELENV